VDVLEGDSIGNFGGRAVIVREYIDFFCNE
jgi:hypothetical protein